MRKLHQAEFSSMYSIESRIANGSFGIVMLGKDLRNNSQRVAIKVERVAARHSRIIYENEITTRLAEKGASVPQILDFFEYKSCRLLVMPCIGPSLEMMYKRYGPFSVKTVHRLGAELLKCLHSAHACGVTHRDIKPENFLIDCTSKMWIIDFGSSKPYGLKDEAKIYVALDNRISANWRPMGPVGTRRFGTIRALKGEDMTFQDDLIALGYCLAYFFGKLPWQGLQLEAAILKMKQDMEERSYLDLFERLPDTPAKDGFKVYMETVTKRENNFKEYKSHYYDKLQRICEAHLNDGELYDWNN